MHRAFDRLFARHPSLLDTFGTSTQGPVRRPGAGSFPRAKEYEADGFLINSVKSCNSFSVGQLHMMRMLEERTGVPGGFIESDLVDSRYFGKANIANRLQSFFQMIEARRGRRVA